MHTNNYYFFKLDNS